MVVSEASETPTPRRGRGRPRNDESLRPVRDELVEATLDLVGRIGVVEANATQVAEAVSARPSSINYHFGGFEKLVAYAGHVAYEQYTETRWKRVWDLPHDPEARLREFVYHQQEWSAKNPGWAAFFNFPSTARRASEVMFLEFSDSSRQLFELNYARFYRLAKDVVEGRVHEDPDWAHTVDPDTVLNDQELLAEVIVLGWTTLGMVVWAARNHDSQLGGMRVTHFNTVAREQAISSSIERLKAMAHQK